MALYQILYWQDIPSQVKAWDDFDEVKLELDPKFMVLIDQKAQTSGVTDADDYLAQWNWSEEKEMEGEVEDVAQAIKDKLEADFVK